MKRKAHFKIIISGTILILLIIFSITCGRKKGPGDGPGQEDGATDQMQFVGRENCKSCHEKQYNLFIGSDHDLAMDEANDSTVLGNFNDASFTQGGNSLTKAQRIPSGRSRRNILIANPSRPNNSRLKTVKPLKLLEKSCPPITTFQRILKIPIWIRAAVPR